MIDPLRYELKLAMTSSGVGYFACHPVQQATFDENLAILRRCPLDEFMHKFLLEGIGRLDQGEVRKMLQTARKRDPIVEALLYEAAFSFKKFDAIQNELDADRALHLMPYTPLITIKWSLLEDRRLHDAWTRIFEANIAEHRQLPPPNSTGLSSPYPVELLLADVSPPIHVGEISSNLSRECGSAQRVMPTAGEAARHALEKLREAGVIAGGEMRHVSSLSPYGFYRKWRFAVEVHNGRHNFTVSGIQTSYGKGLTPEAARASYAMEIVERLSSLAGFGPEGAVGYVGDYPLIHATYSQLAANQSQTLNPNRLRLEVPYDDEPLYWLEAKERSRLGLNPILIPVQSVFLFCNLDEISLFSGLGSTGLASGNTIEQAKVNALLEVIERDCEATTLYEPSRCFRVEAKDPAVRSLLSNSRAKGVRIQFLDLTGGLGVPCYKCFVLDSQGWIVSGSGAHLDGRKALLSALMETPYGYPAGSSLPAGLEELPTVCLEELPNFSTGEPARDLEILEELLIANGFQILYADLTRKDLGIPVVKALIPGMELMADFDQYSRVCPRLFASYVRSFRADR